MTDGLPGDELFTKPSVEELRVADPLICSCGHRYNSLMCVMLCLAGEHKWPHEGPLGTGVSSPTPYEKWVASSWRGTDDLRHLFIATTGLGGEVGEVQECMGREIANIAMLSTQLGKEASDVTESIKKLVRDNRVINRQEFSSELGDILFYLVVIARWQGLTLEDLMMANQLKVNRRYNSVPR